MLPPFQVSQSVFEVPANYHRRGGSRHTPMSNNDEELLQYAIHQSLLESHGVGGQVRGAIAFPKHPSLAVTMSACPAFKTLLTSHICVNVGDDVGWCCRGLHWYSAQEPEWQVGAQDMGCCKKKKATTSYKYLMKANFFFLWCFQMHYEFIF